MREFCPNLEAAPDYQQRAADVNALYAEIGTEVKIGAALSSEEIEAAASSAENKLPSGLTYNFAYYSDEIDGEVQKYEDALAIARRSYRDVEKDAVEFEKNAWVPKELLPPTDGLEDHETPAALASRRMDHIDGVIGILDRRLNFLRPLCDPPETIGHFGSEIGRAQANLDIDRENSYTYGLERNLRAENPQTRRQKIQTAFLIADDYRASTERDINEISFLLGANPQTLEQPTEMTAEMQALERAFYESPGQDFQTIPEIEIDDIDPDMDPDMLMAFAEKSDMEMLQDEEEREIADANREYDRASSIQLLEIDDNIREYRRSITNKTLRNELRSFWQTTKSKFSKQSKEAGRSKSAQLPEGKTQVGSTIGKISVALGFVGQSEEDQTFKYLTDNPFDSPSNVHFSRMNTVTAAQVDRIEVPDSMKMPDSKLRASATTFEFQTSVASLLEAVKEENKRRYRQRR